MLNSISFFFFWLDIPGELFNVVNYFFENACMPNSWGFTLLLSLIKKDNPQNVSNFRPITLCNVCFKIIAKILANRL